METSLELQYGLNAYVVTWVLRARQRLFSSYGLQLWRLEKLDNIKAVRVVKYVIQSSVKRRFVVRENGHCLLAGQSLVTCHSAHVEVVVLIGRLDSANHRFHLALLDLLLEDLIDLDVLLLSLFVIVFRDPPD